MMVADFVNDFVYDRCVADSLIEFYTFLSWVRYLLVTGLFFQEKFGRFSVFHLFRNCLYIGSVRDFFL